MWKVLIRDLESGTGSLTVLVSDGGVGFTLVASTSLDPTEAKDRAVIEDRKTGRAVAKRRVEERRDAIAS